MKPFFRLPERQRALEGAARRWEGTPYFANSESLGHGVGCVNLWRALFAEVGAIPADLALPIYKTDHAHHSTESQLLRFFLEHDFFRGRMMFVPVNDPHPRLPGDLYGVRSGRADHHLAGQVLWGKVAQATEDNGVIIVEDTHTKFLPRVLYVLRLLES